MLIRSNTVRPVCPAKTQISLQTHPVWQGVLLPSLDSPEAEEDTRDQLSCLKIAGGVANSVDPDKTPHSHLGLHCSGLTV